MKKLPLYVCKHTSFTSLSGELPRLAKILEEDYKDTVFFTLKPHKLKGVLYKGFTIVLFVFNMYETSGGVLYEFNRLRGCVVTSTHFYRELLDRLFPGKYPLNNLPLMIEQFVNVQPKTEITDESFKHLWFMLVSDVQECVQSALFVLANYAYSEHKVERDLIIRECLYRICDRDYETATIASEILVKFVAESEEELLDVTRLQEINKQCAHSIWTGRLKANLARLFEEFR